MYAYDGIDYYHQGTWKSGDHFKVGSGSSKAIPSAIANINILETLCDIAVTEIADNAFKNVTGSVTIPQSITTITTLSFVQNKLTSISVNANNENYKSIDGVLFNKAATELISFPANKTNTYTIPNGVTTIGNEAFNNHTTLTSLTIPASVTTINQSAFQYAGKDAASFAVTINGNNLTTIGNSAFQESGLSSITLPQGLTTIGGSAFKQCTKLESINLPSTLTSINGAAFLGCSALTTINFSEATYANTTIGANAFLDCPLSGTITIPAGVTTIGSKAFSHTDTYYSSELETIRIPSSVTSLASDFVYTGVTIYRKTNIAFENGTSWATYYSNLNLALPENLKAYIITGVSGSTVTTTELHYIPTGKAVLLEHTNNESLTEWYTTPTSAVMEQDNSVDFNTNLLIGSTTGIDNISTDSNNKYVLNGDQFIKVHQGSLPAFRCYLSVPDNTVTASNLYIKDNSDNTFIIQEEGTLVNKNNTSVGSATLSADGDNMKLTVTPGANYYAYKADITVRRNITAAHGRAPSLDDTTYDLTIVGEDADPDPSGAIAYTFTPTAGAVYEVTVNFHKRTSLSSTEATRVITLAETSYTYDGTEKEPAVNSFTYNNEPIDAKNYTVSYTNNLNAGSATVTLTGKRECMNTYSTNFSIAKRDINNITVNENLLENCDEDQRLTKTFTGSAITLTAEELGISDLKAGSTTEQAITEDDYTITYENNTTVSTETQKAKVNITSTNTDGSNYQSSKVVYFKIAPKEMTANDIVIPDQAYNNGNPVEPKPTIKYGEITLVEGTDYDIEYADNVYSGVATATFTFKGNYTGTVEKQFNILNHDQAIHVAFDNPDNQWTTYYYRENLALVEGLQAYVVTGLNGTKVDIAEVTFIPKNTPVLLYSESGTKDFNLTTNYSATLPGNITPNNTLFKGTETALTISSDANQTVFVLLNGQFVQTEGGEIAANRCYLVVNNTDIDGITTLDINKNVNDITLLDNLDKTTTKATVTETTKGTLKITPENGYYVTADDITVIRNANTGSARAQQIDMDGGKMTVTAGDIVNNDDYTSTYTFTYDYNSAYQYQIVVRLQQATNIQSNKPSISFTNPTYNGLEQKAKPTVAYGETTLKEGEDYVLVYPGEDYTKAGTGKYVTVWGIRKYCKDLSNNSYAIEKRNISNIKPAAKDGQEWKDGNGLDTDNPQVYYSGSAMELNFTDIVEYKDAQDQDKELDLLANDNLSKEITVTYSNNTVVGTATATIKSNDVNYNGTDRTINFQILQKELTIEDVVIDAIPDQNYTGEAITPKLSIKYNGNTLNEGDVDGDKKDYTVAYSDNINAGEATATISFHGNYTGSIQKKFTIGESNETLTINFDSANEWTTYYASKNLSLTDNLEAFVVTGYEGATLNTKDVDFIPQKTPVLLHRKSGTDTAFDVTTCSTESLDESTVPSDIFKGSLESTDIATVDTDKIKFILLNGQFVQTTTGTLGAGRCYIALDTPPTGVNTLTIGKPTDGIIILEEETEPQQASAIGTVSKATENEITTLTVKANRGWYVETGDITVVRSAVAGKGRAPQVDGNNVTVTAGAITTENETYSTTYLFTYPYSSDYTYQVKVNFHKSTELTTANTIITLNPESYEYDKTVKQPQVTSVKVGDETLTKDVDYVVTYPAEGNINAGKGKVFVNGIRKYNKELTKEFNITKRVIANHITLKGMEGQTWVKDHELGTDDPQVIFTGKDIEVEAIDIVKDAENNETNIITADDYTITYNNNHKDASSTKASVTISSKSDNYQGSKTFSFTILPKEMTSEDIKFKDGEEFEYTGKAIEPEFVITYLDNEFTEGTDYDIAYADNVYAGVATATFTFKGNYSGEVVKKFGIKDHLQPISVNFENPENKWTTYYYKENLALVEGLKAYVVTGRNDLEVLTQEVSFIPKETAVLLYSESGKKEFELTTSYNATLTDEVENSIDRELFKGTETDLDIATVDGTKFVLVNGKFIQSAEGTLAANRCYLVVTEPIDVAELTIKNGTVSEFIYQENGNATTANIGTASTSEPKDGKVTLTVEPKKGYYINGTEDITVVKNAKANSARAQQIDGGNVEVTAGKITDNADYTSTYEFTYPYEANCQYQITVNFHQATNITETGKKAIITPANTVYNGLEQKVEPVVTTYDGKTMTKDVDYVLTYPDDDYTKAANGKKILVNGIRKYTNELSTSFNIEKRHVDQATFAGKEGQTWITGHAITDAEPQVVYTGSAIELDITDIIKNTEGQDVNILTADEATITYNNNTNVGKATVTIEAKNVNYQGKTEKTFAIVAKEMTADNIADIADQPYTGNEVKPALTIKYGDITLTEGEDKDYTVTYSNNINATDEAVAKVKFSGNYTGEAEKKFKIVDVDATFTVAFDSDNEWTTYYSAKNLTLADNLKAYAITGNDGKEVKTAELTFIPKETAVLLYSKSGERTFNVKTCSNETLPEDIVPDRNLFKGTLTSLNIATINGTKFVLVDGKFVQTAEGTLAANRCYLVGNIPGVTTLTIGKGISEVITLEEGTETSAAGSARVITTPDENNNLTLVVKPNNGFYADQENLKVVYSVNAGSARAPEADTPEVAGGEVTLTPVEGYYDTSKEFRYTFPYTKDYFYQVTVDFQKCVNFQTQETQPVITLEEGTYVYDGTEKKPKIASVTITLNDNTVTLTENKDFKVAYDNNVNAGGTAKVIITGMNHYSSEFSKNFNIAQRDINLVTVEAIPDQTYTGHELMPTLYVTDIVKINDEDVDLLNQVKDKDGNTVDDYTPEATDNINVGVAKVSLKANSINYTGIKSGITFNILPKDLSAEGNEPTIEAVETQYYTGEPVEPKLTIHDGELLIPEEDYEVVYSNNIMETTDEAPAVADITFKGNYKGTAKTTFQIVFKSETKVLNVEFGEQDEWTTYYSPIDLNEVEGLNIFVVTGLNKGQGIDLKTEKVTFIPKNIGVLLQRTDMTKTAFSGQTMPSSTTLEGVTPDTDLFRGTSTGIEDMSTIDGVKYILVDDRFVQVVDGALPANRCYVFISNEEAGDIIHVDGDDANGIVIQEEGESSTTAGQVWVELRGDGYKHITVSPSSVTYATKDEIKVVRSIRNPGQASSRNGAPGIENQLVEVLPEDPNVNEDPSGPTHYKFLYDSDYNYQVTVNFKKRINLSDPNVSNPVVTLKAGDIQDLVYDGKPKTPAVEKVTCNGITVDPSNYDVSYENNTNAGRPRVIITGKRFLMGATHTEFYIGKRNFSNVTVKEPIPDQEYNDGAPIEFKGLVLEDIVDGVNIVLETDYTIVCNDTEIGPATVSFLPANNYEGSGKGPFSFNITSATGINQIVVDELEGQWYDLNGQRLPNKPTQKGVYILRDKKRIIKVRIK